MARQGGLDGDFRRFPVADFAHQDDVGILADDRAQPGGEIQVDLGVHLNLADPFDLVLDGVFDGDDVDFRVVDRGQGRVERCRLAAAGGAGYQQDAVGRLDQLVEQVDVPAVHAEIGQFQHRPGFVEQPQHHPFAERGGDDGNPNVHAPVGDLDLDPPILGQALFGDVEPRHDLDAGGQGRLDPAGQAENIVENAVDAVADLQGALVGFDVNVAGPIANGAGEQEVHQLDDGGVAGFIQEVAGLFDLGDDAVRRLFAHFLEKFLGRVPAQVVGQVDRGLNRSLRGKDGSAVPPAEQVAEVVGGLEMGRIVDGDEGALRGFQGNHSKPFQILNGDPAGEIRVHLVRGEFRAEGDLKPGAHGFQKARFGDGLFLQKDLQQASSVSTEFPDRLGQGILRDAGADQEVIG